MGSAIKSQKRIALVILCCVLSACSYTADLVGELYLLPQENIRQAEYKVVTERRLGFKTHDGVMLLADVHRPLSLINTPTILVRIPFSKTFFNRFRSDIIGRFWARRGYTVVIQGTRGRYESGGQFYPLIHEREDGIETLNWLSTQTWFNGHIYMWGGSAFGHTQWAIADQTDPGPDALFIHIASTNFQKMFYPGNAFSLESAVYWAMRSRGQADHSVDIDKLVASINTLPIIDIDDAVVGDTDFFNDWVSQKNNERYWAGIDGKQRAATAQAPVLLLAGWFDPFLPSQLDDYVELKRNKNNKVAKGSKIIIGPWGHAQSVALPEIGKVAPYRRASLADSLPWFDYHSGQSSDTAMNMSPVRIYVMGINQWREENEWPLARTQYQSFYLHSSGNAGEFIDDGKLMMSPPRGTQEADRYVYDPLDPVLSIGGAVLGPRSGTFQQNELEARNDVLVYSTKPLTSPVEVTGPIRAVLYISTDAVSTDFTVKLIDVYPDGKAYNLSDGIIRKSYKQPLDQPQKIEFEIWPTSNVFMKDHKIRVEISSSNFPRYNRNLNTGKDPATAVETSIANQIVFHSEKYPSKIILPVIPAEVEQ